MAELGLQLQQYRLTTANILYFLPDHPSLLQSFVWQTYDRAPEFPRILKFLDFWQREIEGRIHSVQLAAAGLVKPAEFRFTDGIFTMH